MARERIEHHFTHVIALMLLSAVLLCACQNIPLGSSTGSSEITSETVTSTDDEEDYEFYFEDPYPVSLSTTNASNQTGGSDASGNGESNSGNGGDDDVIDATGDDGDKPSEGQTEAPTYNPNIAEAGVGEYTYMVGNTKLRSTTDVSMLLQPEDGTVYDFGARKGVQCTWIDSFYLRGAYKMKAYDATYRWLGYYNKDFSVTFKPYKAIGDWKSPKGNKYKLYLVEIYIVSHNMEIKILPKSSNKAEDYTVSINGRGYYASLEQLQMLDFVLSALTKKPYIDPLEGLYTGKDHIYYV